MYFLLQKVKIASKVTFLDLYSLVTSGGDLSSIPGGEFFKDVDTLRELFQEEWASKIVSSINGRGDLANFDLKSCSLKIHFLQQVLWMKMLYFGVMFLLVFLVEIF